LGTRDTLNCGIFDDENVSGTAAALTSGSFALQDATSLPLLGLIPVPTSTGADTVRLFCDSAKVRRKSDHEGFLAQHGDPGDKSPLDFSQGSGYLVVTRTVQRKVLWPPPPAR
jgi:hypothetical protein